MESVERNPFNAATAQFLRIIKASSAAAEVRLRDSALRVSGSGGRRDDIRANKQPSVDHTDH
ncbi:hypothetical protein RvY_01358 [Ramazzottius varieornatus]|uniref:Uncharacterized protein n=1 Tax=Ramazzottius varieornatus TaxID=947166 RepID=A0A1D1UR98_RAMVA|nr:hypothetical protein RvY_01358 [Ramazzottius varieornatus]